MVEQQDDHRSTSICLEQGENDSLEIQTDSTDFDWKFQKGLKSIDLTKTDAVLGLFDSSHVKYNYQVDGISDEVPTLSEMTLEAIRILQKNEKGFFLFVEGGRIDHAHHDTMAQIALDETVEFAKAIRLAKEALGDDTLIVVTADHAHTMSISGYPERGTNILGVAGRSDKDGLPYLKLSYANGMGYYTHKKATGGRVDPTNVDLQKADTTFPATVPLDSETHGGDDVVVYATGPSAHLFQGTFEQNLIPHIMAYASCVGDGLHACSKQ